MVAIGGATATQYVDNSLLDVFDVGSGGWSKQPTLGFPIGESFCTCWSVRELITRQGRASRIALFSLQTRLRQPRRSSCTADRRSIRLPETRRSTSSPSRRSPGPRSPPPPRRSRRSPRDEQDTNASSMAASSSPSAATFRRRCCATSRESTSTTSRREGGRPLSQLARRTLSLPSFRAPRDHRLDRLRT